MTDHSLYFHDNARRAAEHILAGPFGARLRQLVVTETSDRHGYLAVHLRKTPTTTCRAASW